MSLVESALSFYRRLRFRYPASMPCDIAQALGVEMSNAVPFKKMLNQVLSPTCRPTKLQKFMPREKAERMFQNALRKECFSYNSIFSYYFPDGWLEFELKFDEHSKLRRIFVHHKLISHRFGYEMELSCCNKLSCENNSL